MIYSSYAEVEREYGYAQGYIAETKKRAVNYLCDVTFEVGSLGVMVDGKPNILTHTNKKAKLYDKIGGQGKPIEDLSVEQLVALAKQVHDIHPVQEWGDPEPEPENGEGEGEDKGGG